MGDSQNLNILRQGLESLSHGARHRPTRSTLNLIENKGWDGTGLSQ